MRKRIEWIDMSKGYGVILVIIGHFGINGLGNWIYSFHMPLFFFLAGYVFKSEIPIKEFFLRKVKGLIIPYIFLGLGAICFNILLMLYVDTFDLEEVIRQIKCLFFQIRYSNLWFLTCLFILNIIFFIIFNLKLTDIFITILVFLMTVLGILYYKIGGNPLIWNMDVCLPASLFFWLGFLYKKYNKYIEVKSKTLNRWLLILIFFSISLILNYLIFVNKQEGLEMFNSQYGNPLYTYIVAIFGIMFILKVSEKKTISFIQFIGENTLLYFAWHQNIMMPLIEKLLEKVGFSFEKIDMSMNFYYLYYILNLILILLMTTILTKCILKSKLKILIGR